MDISKQLTWSITADTSSSATHNKDDPAPPKQGILAEGETLWWGNGIVLPGMFGGDTPAAGIRFTDEQAMAVSTVYACSRAIAENLASLPGLVYRQKERSRELARDSDPWYLLHDEPNPEMDSFTFWELAALRLENRGNAFAEIERDGSDRPVALWPIHNSRVEPYRIEDGSIEWRVTMDAVDPRYEYHRWYSIPDRNMLNIVGFGGNGYIAPGTIPMAREQIGFAIAAQQFGASFFKGGGRPAGFVEMPGYISDEDERREFRADLNKMHMGKDNWHKMGVLWHGGKWKEMQYSPEQAQFIESQQFSDKRICQFYRVPPSIVQIFDDFKFSTVDSMLRSFVMTCLRPIAVRFERGVNRKLMKYREASRGRLVDAFNSPMIFEFLLEALLRGDAKAQAETLEIKRRNAIINSDEWRALDNDPPLPNGQGQHYVLPGGFVRLDQMTSNPATGQGSSTTKQQIEKPVAEFDRMKLAEAIQQSGLLPKKVVVHGVDSEELVSEIGDEVLSEAVQRVNQVASTELTRISKVTDKKVREAKLTDLRGKHLARLQSAVAPAANIYMRSPQLFECETADELASMLATKACEEFFQMNLREGAEND